MNIFKFNFLKKKSFTAIHVLLIIFQIYNCHAQQPALRNQRTLQPTENRTGQNHQMVPEIQGYRLIDTIRMSRDYKPGNTYPGRTYVFQSDNKKITALDRSFYGKLDTGFRSTYTEDEIRLIPEVFVITGSATGSQYIYRIGFESRLPLRYQFGSNRFEGKMKFFLLCDASLPDYNLPDPVLIEVVSDDIGSISPESKEIDHISLPSTDLELQDPDLSDSAQVKIITRSNPEGYEIYLPVVPALVMDTTRRSLQGLGVQKIPVHIRLIGSSSPDSVEVKFNVNKGTIEPEAVYVRPGRPATVYLRSEGLGYAKLTATSAVTSNGIGLHYTFPWVFILMALTGGVLGGLLRFFTDSGDRRLVKSILKGALLGFIGAVVYYVLGFSLIKFEVSDIFNEFAVLGFSALVAYFGIQIG